MQMRRKRFIANLSVSQTVRKSLDTSSGFTRAGGSITILYSTAINSYRLSMCRFSYISKTRVDFVLFLLIATALIGLQSALAQAVSA